MIFWIYNDNGNVYIQFNVDLICMEIQVQVFGYVINDELNDMIFQCYKLINCVFELIDFIFFVMWVDLDLGCYIDDFIGCDIVCSLGYVYNEDVFDGQMGCQCFQGVNIYCDEILLFGVDYFCGLFVLVCFGENGELILIEVGENFDIVIELGMFFFIYYNNGGFLGIFLGIFDFGQFIEYYWYFIGYWCDGILFIYGGEVYQDGIEFIDYVYIEVLDDVDGWFMCIVNVMFGQDCCMIQVFGFFLLSLGVVNELIIGVVWVVD